MEEQNDMAPWACCSFITFPSKMTDNEPTTMKDGRMKNETKDREGEVEERSVPLAHNCVCSVSSN